MTTKKPAPLVVRPATTDDVPAILDLMKACYPWVDPNMEARLRSQLRIFPAGQLVVVQGLRVLGLASTMRLDLDDHPAGTWKEVSDDGFIRNHDPEGPDLYGVDLMVHPEARRMRIGARLYRARRQLAIDTNARRIVFGGRMPGYHKHADAMTPEEYLEKVQDQRLVDQVVTFQLNQGFTPQRILHDYLPWDKQSCGHAVEMEWVNLLHRGTGRAVQAIHPVRVCIVQYQMKRVADYDGFLNQVRELVSVASDYEADFCVFPELIPLQCATYYPKLPSRETIRRSAADLDRYVDAFREMALRFNVNLLGGSHPVEDNGRLYNVAFLFHRDGRVSRQAKIHITPGEHEEAGFLGGDDIAVFETDRCKVGIPVCYDIEFPELSRIMVDQGARILLVPYSTRDRQGHLRVTRCAQARAIENQVFVVTAGTIGNQPGANGTDIHYAQSGVYTPSDFSFGRDGVQAECPVGVETVLVADLDLAQLRRSRRTGTVRPYSDRRSDLYSIVMHKTDDKR